MAATRASGTNAVRYGTMRECVLGLTAVLADGRVVRTGGRARKSSAGYDLTRLLVGSEGTLGVITEVQLRLFGIPEAISAAVCVLPDPGIGAVNSVILTIQMGIPVARIELWTRSRWTPSTAIPDLDYPVQPTLFFEFHGSSAASVEEHAETVGAIAAENGGGDFRWTDPCQEDRNKLWQARHDAYYACLALRPGAQGLATDVCVPISRLAECILETKARHGRGLGPACADRRPRGRRQLPPVLPASTEDKPGGVVQGRGREPSGMVLRALAMGGTCTGEHGIGHGKLDFLTAEHGTAVPVMRQVKAALDPDNIMNPGKMLRMN